MNSSRQAFLIWLVLVWLSILWLTAHDSQPSPGALAPARWPRLSSLPSPGREPLLLIFLHPYCPCAQSSLSQLTRLQASSRRHFQIVAVIGLPGRLTRAEASDILNRLQHIPEARVFLDPDLQESRRFGCYTSGQTLLYSPQGRLRYQGGLTGSSAHEGDNPGFFGVLAALGQDSWELTSQPVFGCVLRKDEFCGRAPGNYRTPPSCR